MHFCAICEITFRVDGPLKSNVVLEKSLKNGCYFFCINPVIVFLTCLAGGTDNHLVLLDLRPRVSLLVVFEYSTMTSSRAFLHLK